MTKLMEKAFQRASSLPNDMQDLIARDLINEIDWETQWDKIFEKSQDAIDELSQKALEEHKRGETENIGFDTL